MKLYGFWRSLATYRVRVALGLKNLIAEEVSIDLLHGEQHGSTYRALNPQSAVPALVLDAGPPLVQSLAILEYLEETHPEPPLLPRDPRGRARVRGLAQIVACEGHPLVVPRIRSYLERELRIEEAGRNRWLQHWTGKALAALEGHLSGAGQTGRYCHGDMPTIADICLASQVLAAGFFNCPLTDVPTVARIYAACMQLDAFDRAQPLKQPGAPAGTGH